MVMRSLFPVVFLRFLAFCPRMIGGNVSLKKIIPNAKVKPVQKTSTHITHRHVVRSEMYPAMIGAIVGAMGGPSENIATAFPLSFASHMSDRTPAPIASGAPPPRPEMNRNTANWAVSLETAHAMLNTKNISMETCRTIALVDEHLQLERGTFQKVRRLDLLSTDRPQKQARIQRQAMKAP